MALGPGYRSLLAAYGEPAVRYAPLVEPSGHGATRATVVALALATGCASAHHVPADPWSGIERDAFLELRGMVPGPGPSVQLPLASVDDDPTEYPDTAAALANAGDFAFAFRQSSNFMHRFDVLMIDATGHATLTLGATSQRAAFRLSNVELDRLKKMLILIDALHPKRSYRPRRARRSRGRRRRSPRECRTPDGSERLTSAMGTWRRHRRPGAAEPVPGWSPDDAKVHLRTPSPDDPVPGCPRMTPYAPDAARAFVRKLRGATPVMRLKAWLKALSDA
jgi:hypothetical protein